MENESTGFELLRSSAPNPIPIEDLLVDLLIVDLFLPSQLKRDAVQSI